MMLGLALNGLGSAYSLFDSITHFIRFSTAEYEIINKVYVASEKNYILFNSCMFKYFTDSNFVMILGIVKSKKKSILSTDDKMLSSDLQNAFSINEFIRTYYGVHSLIKVYSESYIYSQ